MHQRDCDGMRWPGHIGQLLASYGELWWVDARTGGPCTTTVVVSRARTSQLKIHAGDGRGTAREIRELHEAVLGLHTLSGWSKLLLGTSSSSKSVAALVERCGDRETWQALPLPRLPLPCLSAFRPYQPFDVSTSLMSLPLLDPGPIQSDVGRPGLSRVAALSFQSLKVKVRRWPNVCTESPNRLARGWSA